MFKSKNNMVFNGIDLAERFNRSREFLIIKSVSGRSYIPTSREIIQVPNKPGGYSKPLRTNPRVLEIEYYVKAESHLILRKKIEELNEIIYADVEARIQFADEMDRIYYGEISDASQTDESLKMHQGILTIICTDPYKYAVTPKTVNGLTIHNQGTTHTPFAIEMEVTAPATNLTVSDGKNSLMIGKYISTTQYTEVLKAHEPLEDMVAWTPIAGLFSDYTEMGNIVSSDHSDGSDGSYYGKYFDLVNVGSAGQWYGRSIVKGVGTTKDFRLEGVFGIAKKIGEQGIVRQYVILVDDLGKEVGRMGILTDGGTNINRLTVRIGNNENNVTIIDSSGEIFTFADQVFCKLILEKKGNVYKASVVRVDRTTGVEIKEELTAFYTDYLNLYTKPLSALAIHMAEKTDQVMGIYDIKLYEYVDESVTNPYVVSVGDIVKVDMGSRAILINGQIRNVNKNIQSDYFNLSPGKNILHVSPSVTTNQKVTIRERYL